MDKYVIHGGGKLRGTVEVQSAKNSVLALLAAALLAKGESVIERCPVISDVENMIRILEALGARAERVGEDLILNTSAACKTEIPEALAKELRASVFLLGPILARFKRAKVAYPGGCEIGARPIDLHLNGLKSIGVKIKEEDGYILCDGREMRGAPLFLDMPSVGATENIIMAAALTKGTTVIYNAAREPEIVDLQNFINAMGGRVAGAGSARVVIEGVRKLRGARFLPVPDRIAAGTFVIAALISGGEVTVKTPRPADLDALIKKFITDNACQTGVFSDTIKVKAYGRLKTPPFTETRPYPGFPTDLQAQFLSLAAVCEGTGVVVENMFETRYRHAVELVKMGADITVLERAAVVRGVERLHGAELNASDLRGGAALVLAALAAEGESTVHGVRRIDRGYENFEGTLAALGADIKRIRS